MLPKKTNSTAHASNIAWLDKKKVIAAYEAHPRLQLAKWIQTLVNVLSLSQTAGRGWVLASTVNVAAAKDWLILKLPSCKHKEFADF